MKKCLFLAAVLVFTLSCVSASATDVGLVAHWTFEEGTGTTAGDSAGTNTGTLKGNPTWVPGAVGDYALDFDGSGDYVQIPDAGSLTPANQITIAYWIYKRSGQHAGIFKSASCPNESNSPGNSRAYRLYISDSTSKVGFTVFSSVGTFDTVISNGIVSPNQWHHIAVTFNHGNTSIYIDGQLDSTSTMSVNSIMNDAQPLIIGGYWNYCGTDNFVTRLDGMVDDLRIYNRALSAEEIQQLWPPTALEITGPDTVNKNQQAQYTATAIHSEGAAVDVTSPAIWSVEPNDYGNIDANGLFTAADMHLSADIIIRAKYTANGVTVEDELTVSYIPSPPGRYISEALTDKEEALDLIDYATENEQKATEALEQILDIGDYGDLKKTDIIKAKQKIHSALQRQQQAKDALQKSIRGLQEVLDTLGYEPPPLLPAPIAHWTFDEGAGTNAGDSIGTNHGALTGDPTWVAGKIGNYALDFDGSSDYVALPDNNPIWLPQNDLTVSFWVYFNTDAVVWEHLIDLNCGRSSAASNRLGYMVSRTDSGKILFYMVTGSGTLDELYSTPVIPGGGWYHIVAVRDGTTQAIYINGSLDNDRTCSASAIDFTGAYDDDTVNLGGFTSNGNPIHQTLNGQLDDVRIYDVALTAEEIQQFYQYQAGL